MDNFTPGREALIAYLAKIYSAAIEHDTYIGASPLAGTLLRSIQSVLEMEHGRDSAAGIMHDARGRAFPGTASDV